MIFNYVTSALALLSLAVSIYAVLHNNRKARDLEKEYEEERLNNEAIYNERKQRASIELSRQISSLLPDKVFEIYVTQYGRVCVLTNTYADIRNDGRCSVCDEETSSKGYFYLAGSIPPPGKADFPDKEVLGNLCASCAEKKNAVAAALSRNDVACVGR